MSHSAQNKKYALVTGGSGALGSAICKRLAQDGIFVLVHANKNLQAAQMIVDAITSQGGQAKACSFDVSDAKSCQRVFDELNLPHPIQILVNNSGIHSDAVFAGMSAAQWHEVINVSLHGFFNVTQPLTLPMLTTRWGRIINISSVAAQAGNRGQVNYSAAKSALHGATKSLAIEVASRGVTVNTIAPGIIESPMLGNSFDATKITHLVPMKRAGKPEEVAHLVAFLASEQAAYITGQIIGINGGML